MHDDLVALVERMLEMNRQLRETVGREREEMGRKGGEIDELPCEFYGITRKKGGLGESLDRQYV